MVSFEVGSENASTMAGSVLRDERVLKLNGVKVTGMREIDIEDGARREGWSAWFRKAEKKRSLSRTKWR
ncbi:unnamed protein product [Lasius platythorax]|uniref:PDZ domain-containing protein n=1 Tax=Lasius platythorax TaxID=488582 RepID=A0AAV2NLM1_9HYME